MNLITTLIDELGSAGLRLRKAQPRGPGRLSMELDAADGSLCAGQWHSDATQTHRVAARVRDRFGSDSVAVLGGGAVLVQHAGADRRLLALRRLLAGDGAVLVAHRPERRAVVRLGESRYVKVVRPGRTTDIVASLRLVRPDNLRIPEVVDADDDGGLVTITAVPGRTLLEALSDPATDSDQLAADVKQVGKALRHLHAHTAELSRAVHDVVAEVAAAQNWLEAASGHRLLDPEAWQPLVDRVAARLPPPPPRLALVHRDLHDKQIVLAAHRPVGLLDLDLAAYGDPALDLANLLAHLDLRFRQGRCSQRRATLCAEALLEGYSPDPALVRRLAPYLAITRLRLAGVYSFRPAPAGLVAGLIRDVEEPRVPWE